MTALSSSVYLSPLRSVRRVRFCGAGGVFCFEAGVAGVTGCGGFCLGALTGGVAATGRLVVAPSWIDAVALIAFVSIRFYAKEEGQGIDHTSFGKARHSRPYSNFLEVYDTKGVD
jgi:hypothetical protein